MAGSLLSRVVFPALVQIYTSELSRISRVLGSGVAEVLLRMLEGESGAPAVGVVGGFGATASSSSMALTIGGGLAVRYSALGVDLSDHADHPYRLISQRSEAVLELEAGDATHPRIDAIVVTDGESDARAVAVKIWDEDAGDWAPPDSRHTERRNTPSFAVVKGTPAASPAAPTYPGSYVPLWSVRVPAGATNLAGATLTDLRQMIGGFGHVLARFLRLTGGTLSGALSIAGSTAAHCFGVQMSGTPGRVMAFGQPGSTSAGLWVAGTSALNGPSAPELEVRGHTGSVSGTHASAGTVYAADGALHYSAKNYAGSAEYKVAKAATRRTELWQEGAVAGGRLDVGNVRVLDSDPAPADLTAGDMGAMYRASVPWCAARIVGGSPPTISGSLNVSSVSRVALGQYQITLVIPFSSHAAVRFEGSCLEAGLAPTVLHYSQITANTFQVMLYDVVAGALVDYDFSVAAYQLAAH